MSASYDPNHVTKLGELYTLVTGIWAKCKNLFAAKSDLATVATSGSYNDLSNKPSIPAAQVQSNWNQSDSNAVDYIKNKPSIPAAQVQSDWNQSDSNAVDYIQNKPTIPIVDQTYSSSSTNAQSGTAVAGAIATVKQVPASVAADEGKVLVVDSSGNAAWDPLATTAQIQAIVV